MTASKLLSTLQKLLHEYPDLREKDVFVDTEARRFNSHLVNVTACYAELNESEIILYLDYSGSDL